MGFSRENILERLHSIEDLPSIPPMVIMLVQAIGKEGTNADDLSKLIGEDVSMTSRLLKMANSAFYGPSLSKISSIQSAVLRLGFEEVRRLCLCLSMANVFKQNQYSIDYLAFWKHSLNVGICTKVVLEYSTKPESVKLETCFTAGLLHDVGVFILDQFFPEEFKHTRQIMEDTGETAFQVELNELGIDHAEIGGQLLKNWGFPDELIQSVTYHHDPDKSTKECLTVTQMVHMADHLCNNQGIYFQGSGITSRFSYGAWNDLGLNLEDVTSMLAKVTEEAKRSEFLGPLFKAPR